MAGHCVAALPPWNRVPALPATRAALPRKNTTGSNAIKKRESTDANASFVSAGTQRCPACSHSDYCTSFRYRPLDCGRAVVPVHRYSNHYQNASRSANIAGTRRYPAYGQNAVRSADIAGNRRFPACSQNASHSDDITGRRPASGQNPADSNIVTRERRSLERQ